MATLSRVESGRGAAALAVLLFHSSASTHYYYHRYPLRGAFLFGYSGIYFFFVLSGFLIALAHARDVGRPKAVGRYLLKRFIRIFPPYWVVFPPIAALYFITRAPATINSFTPLNLLSEFLLSPFGNQMHGIMYVAWTLHLEVLFYLLFACLILNRTVGLALIGLWQLLVLGTCLGLFSHPDFLSRAAISGNLGFLLGMLALLLFSSKFTIPARLVTTFGLLIFLTAGWLDVARQRPYIALYLFASFLLVLGLAKLDQISKTKAPKAATSLGVASYSIYLVHYPVISIVSKMIARLDRATRLPMEVYFVLVAMAALLVSLAFYRLVERPLLATLRERLLSPRSQRKLYPETEAVV
jgi:exopolysaccharide production protein ExoZ